MADRFMDRVAEMAGHTVRRLRELQWVLAGAGLEADAADLEAVIRAHEEVVVDCAEDTGVTGMPKHPRTPPGAEKPTDR